MPETKYDPVAPHTPPISVSRLSTEVNRTGSWKYTQPVYHDRVAPCSAGCPTGVDIAGYMALLRDNQVSAAIDLLLRENPMPAVTGRVCNHPCEKVCNRSAFDGAVAIHAVERALGDLALEGPMPEALPPRHPERVAVVGSGPAGLACAYHLVRFGYGVALFEQEAEAGGMLRIGIPEYRLPRRVLDQQIERYSAMGIVFHTGVRVGADVSWAKLNSDFAAVFIASGAHVSKVLELEGGSGTERLVSGLAFLRRVNAGERPNLGRQVLVIGGGNTAVDCARVALRLGSEVRVVYRRSREEMPAIAEEVEDAEREGVSFEFFAAPARLLNTDGNLTLVCSRMLAGEMDAKGRARPVESGAPPLELRADSVITAIGEDVELQVLPAELRAAGPGVDTWGSSAADNIFLGGDLAGDERTVATALGAGKRAAIGIDRHLRNRRGEEAAEPAEALKLGREGGFSAARWTHTDPVKRVNPLNDIVTPADINTSDFAHASRHEDHHRGLAGTFEETNAGLGVQEALSEAVRCFQCGVCNECELCQIYCSEAAISRDPENGRFIIDLDHCKGCGVCVVECPRGAITMERLGA